MQALTDPTSLPAAIAPLRPDLQRTVDSIGSLIGTF